MQTEPPQADSAAVAPAGTNSATTAHRTPFSRFRRSLGTAVLAIDPTTTEAQARQARGHAIPRPAVPTQMKGNGRRGSYWRISTSVPLYLGDTLPPLSQEDERECLRVWQHERGTEAAAAAGERLVRANVRFVHLVVKHYAGGDVERYRALMSAGAEGLVVAMDRFDLDSPFKFITYAVHWIRQRCLLELDTDRNVRAGGSGNNIRAAVARRRHELEQRLACDVTDVEAIQTLIEECYTSAAVGRSYLHQESPEWSLNAPMQDSHRPWRLGEQRTWMETVVAPPDCPLEAIEATEVAQAVGDMVAQLPARKRQIVAEYFGMTGNRGSTLDQIGQRLGLTRERVRQILAATLADLRRRIDHPQDRAAACLAEALRDTPCRFLGAPER